MITELSYSNGMSLLNEQEIGATIIGFFDKLYTNFGWKEVSMKKKFGQLLKLSAKIKLVVLMVTLLSFYLKLWKQLKPDFIRFFANCTGMII